MLPSTKLTPATRRVGVKVNNRWDQFPHFNTKNSLSSDLDVVGGTGPRTSTGLGVGKPTMSTQRLTNKGDANSHEETLRLGGQ